MKAALTMIFFLLFLANLEASGQNVTRINTSDLEQILSSREDILLVVNFWATWCPPCVRELPAFESVSNEFDKSKVRFVMISIDFPSQIESQLIPFLKKNKISLDVSVMLNTDYDSWMNIVDPEWNGSIPATLFLNNFRKNRHFHSGEITETSMRKLIHQMNL